MPQCSLCGNEMPPEGGAVLFADSRGIPFEVCGACEAHIDALRCARSDAEAGKALQYISERAGNLDRRDTYDSLVAFIGANRAHGAGPEQELETPESAPEEPAPAEQTAEESGEGGKRGIFRSVIFVAAIVALLLLAWLLGGFNLF